MSFWLTDSLKKFLVSEEDAKFLLVGSGEIEEGKFGCGIFCATNDEFTAYRARKLIQQSSDNEVWIVLNSLSTRTKIAQMLGGVLPTEVLPPKEGTEPSFVSETEIQEIEASLEENKKEVSIPTNQAVEASNPEQNGIGAAPLM